MFFFLCIHFHYRNDKNEEQIGKKLVKLVSNHIDINKANEINFALTPEQMNYYNNWLLEVLLNVNITTHII